MLFGVGAAVVAVDRFFTPAVIGIIVASIVLGYGLMGVVWFNQTTGISGFITGSWQALSGVDTPGEIVRASCDDPTIWSLVGLLVALFNVIPGVVAIVGVPAGLIACLIGGLMSLALGDEDPIYKGLTVLGVGLIGLVSAGLIMRLMHWMDNALVCPSG